MKQLIRDTPTGERIIIQEVPEDAYDLSIKESSPNKQKLHYWVTDKIYVTNQRLEILPFGDHSLLGTVGKSGISFDPDGLVEKVTENHYRDYSWDDPMHNLLGSKHKSFLSFLNREGVVFENKYDYATADQKEYMKSSSDYKEEKKKEWQSEQSKVWQKAVVILIK